MEYELRIIVEKVSVSNQEVVRRDTIKTYDVERPESILDLGLRHAEQISLLEKVQNAVLAKQASLLDSGNKVCPKVSVQGVQRRHKTPPCWIKQLSSKVKQLLTSQNH